MYVCTYHNLLYFVLHELYENFLHENFAQDQDTLIEQSICKKLCMYECRYVCTYLYIYACIYAL